jgi:hypothetical protein
MTAQPLILGFNNIVGTATADIAAMQGLGPFTALSDEQIILDALTQVSFHSPDKGGFRLNSHFRPQLTTRSVRPCAPTAPQYHHWQGRPPE